MLKPCAHNAAKYGMEATSWQTQLCGLCLGLRDGHGQLARAATNTDAIVLGVLTEAQQTLTLERTDAGPCPLRGMRKASVAPADSPAYSWPPPPHCCWARPRFAITSTTATPAA